MKKISIFAVGLVFLMIAIITATSLGAEQDASVETPKALLEPGPILNDIRIPEDRVEGFRVSGLYYAPSFYETSEYMYGDISVAIILPESNGAIDPETEDWTQEEIDNVYSEIQDGLNWWITNKHLLAEVNFIIHEPQVIETSYEPITRPSDPDEAYWINEIMNYVGYNSGDYFEKVRAFDNYLRIQDNTDWAFTIFVVDSSNDVDGAFSDFYFAYAYLFGPFMVMTYDNNGYGISNMDAVTAHEAGHIFMAADEYSGAWQCDEQNDCNSLWGFLHVENQNCAYNCSSNEDCIMRSQISPYTNGAICYYTKGQLGWRDLDGDNIIDCSDSTYNTDSDTDSDGIVDYWDSCTDTDNDGYGDPGFESNTCGIDNCPNNYNPDQNDSDSDLIGNVCDNCPDTSNPDQLDSYPPGGNNCGDACDCEGDFDHDGDVMHGDIPAFKADMGRWSGYKPCIAQDPCKGDFDCDGDVMQGDIPIFKADMGRFSGYNPCPPGSGVICSY